LRSLPNRPLFDHPELQQIYGADTDSEYLIYLVVGAPVPSANGRYLAITSPLPSGPDIRPGRTWIGDLVTGEVTPLGRPALAATWSPDGHRMTYVLDETLYVWDVASGQEPVAIFNRELFYAFQGLSDEGSAYVSAILPVSHPMLPVHLGVFKDEPHTLARSYDTYITWVVERLNEQDASSFTPGLDQLDALIGSLEIQ
jgi:hypothetical protein